MTATSPVAPTSHVILLPDARAERARAVLVEGALPTVDDAVLGLAPPFGDAALAVPRITAGWTGRALQPAAAARDALGAVLERPTTEALADLREALAADLARIGPQRVRAPVEQTLTETDALLAWSDPMQAAGLAVLAANAVLADGAAGPESLLAAATALACAAAAEPRVCELMPKPEPTSIFGRKRGRATGSVAGLADGYLNLFAAAAALVQTPPGDVDPDEDFAHITITDAAHRWLDARHDPVLDPDPVPGAATLDDLLCPPDAEDPVVDLRADLCRWAAALRAGYADVLAEDAALGEVLADIAGLARLDPARLHVLRRRAIEAGQDHTCENDQIGRRLDALARHIVARLAIVALLLGDAEAGLVVGCWIADRLQQPLPDVRVRLRLATAALLALRVAASGHPCALAIGADVAHPDLEGREAVRILERDLVRSLFAALAGATLAPRAEGTTPGTLAAIRAEAEAVPPEERRSRARARDLAAARADAGTRALVVVTAVADGKSSTARECLGEWGPLVGRPVPLAPTPDIPSVFRTLVAEAPHARGVLDRILRDTVASPTVRIRPTLIWGPPGGGKTRLVTRLCAALGLPCRVYACGGASDAAFAGTSRQWNSARASVPLQAIKVENTANAALVLDEIEKTGTGRQNGNLTDALLAMLEPTSATRHFDLYLEAPVDLSRVTWFATANDIRDLQPALRDRFRILELPEPTADHLPALLPAILGDLTAARGLDPIWVPPLAPEEIAAVAGHWRGGSIRRLARLVARVLDARERLEMMH